MDLSFSIFTTITHEMMSQYNSSNSQIQLNPQSNMFDAILSLFIFVMAILASISITISEKENRKSFLPTTIHDTASSTGVCKSPSSGNTIRRTTSNDNIIINV